MINGIFRTRYTMVLKKEVLRKSIHLAAAFTPLVFHVAHYPALIFLCVVLCAYSVAEYLRRSKGIGVPVFSTLTAACERKRDENKFVLGPVTLCTGIIITAFFFEEKCAAVGIYALAFGDGLASLVGKCFGTIHIPFAPEKTAAGSLACFASVFAASFLVTRNSLFALILAFAAMFLELLPLKDYDNIVIPIAVASLSQFVLRVC
ncbi:MAG: phosphatidate cytidylyltransferase [Treponemataceae bacterium]|nr:MAG: phosphatidate cytidylyltransferase [Treponemataceae bacterium]